MIFSLSLAHGRCAARFLQRCVAVLWAVLLGAILAIKPSFAQTNLNYAEDGGGLCSGEAVANGKCTVRIMPTEEGAVQASSFDDTLTVPVEIVLEQRISGTAESNLEGQGSLHPAFEPFFPDDPILVGGLAVIHRQSVPSHAHLTVTITETGEIAPRNDESFDDLGLDLRMESNADVTVDNQGVILTPVEDAIKVQTIAGSTGAVTIKNRGVLSGRRAGEDFEARFSRRGIAVEHSGTGPVSVEHAGEGLIRIHGDGISVAVGGAADVRITAGGTSTIEARDAGIYATDLRLRSESLFWVRVNKDARVFGGRQGIHMGASRTPPSRTCDVRASADFGGAVFQSCAMVLGTVESDGSSRHRFNAAVTIESSGVLTIGPKGRVVATDDSIPAVRFRDTGPALIRYLAHRGEKGKILGDVVGSSDGEPISYQVWVLADDVDVDALMDAVEENSLTEQQLQRVARQIDLSQGGGAFARGLFNVELDSTCQVIGEPLAPRARVFEALPSVLLSVNRPVAHDDRRRAPRADGWWLWTEAADGTWDADRSVSDVEYDYDRRAVETGVDLTVGENAVIGLSAHYRDIDADIDDGGRIEAEGYGLGLSGTLLRGKAYVAGQISATWYEVDLNSSEVGVMRKNVDGFGFSAGAEIGTRLQHGDLTVVPRIGITHSRVDVDDFKARADPQVGVWNDVSLKDGKSLLGRAGIRVERGKLYGSVDLEREFSEDERRVEAAGTALNSESDDVWVRAAVGGIHEWGGDRYSITARLGYRSSGGDNNEFGGSLMLQMRF